MYKFICISTCICISICIHVYVYMHTDTHRQTHTHRRCTRRNTSDAKSPSTLWYGWRRRLTNRATRTALRRSSSWRIICSRSLSRRCTRSRHSRMVISLSMTSLITCAVSVSRVCTCARRSRSSASRASRRRFSSSMMYLAWASPVAVRAASCACEEILKSQGPSVFTVHVS